MLFAMCAALGGYDFEAGEAEDMKGPRALGNQVMTTGNSVSYPETQVSSSPFVVSIDCIGILIWHASDKVSCAVKM